MVLIVGPVVLSLLWLVSLWLLGRGVRAQVVGWVVTLADVAVVGPVYAIITGQWGFLVANAVATVIGVRNVRTTWRLGRGVVGDRSDVHP
jgi:hypothetical protein